MAIRLGDLLVDRGILTDAQRIEILEEQRTTSRPFGELAERLFDVSESVIEEAWAEQYAGLAERVDPRVEPIDPDVIKLVDRRQAWQFGVLPLKRDGDEVIVCTTTTNLPRALRFVGWRIPRMCVFQIATAEQLAQALQVHYPLAGMGVHALAE